MRRSLLTLALVVLATLCPKPVHAEEGVATRLVFLVGHTSPDSGTAPQPLPVVWQLDSAASTLGDQADPADLGAVVTSLETTLRLDRVQTRSSHTSKLAVGGSTSMNLHNPGGLRATAQLTGLDAAGTASYQVRIEAGGKVLADTPVVLQLGKRAVVGALDGPAAPYVFLVVEARDRVTDAPAPAAGKPPHPLTEVQVTYTAPAREIRVQGVVILAVDVDATGKVVGTKVLKGLPMGLAEEAVRAVESTAFAPAVDANGTAVAATVNLAISFRIDE